MLLIQVLVTMMTVSIATSTRCKCLCCGDLCKKVLIFLMFILTVCSEINNTTDIQDLCDSNAITPTSPYFLEGEDIVLTCSVPDVPAETLTFVKGREEKNIPDEFIHKQTENSIKMVIPNVTEQDMDRTKDSTQYKCVNKSNISQCYDNIHVRLECKFDYPREPVDLDCRIYDFEEMTCTWSLGVDYHRSHDIDVKCQSTSFSFKSDNPRASWALCPDQNRTSCHWDSDNYLAPYMIIVKVSVTSVVRNITIETNKTFYQYDMMVPGPVKGLSVRRAHGDRCLQLDWEPTAKYYKFRFNVSYNSSCTPMKSVIVIYSGNNFENYKLNDNRILCGVTPYTEYTYTVIGQLIEEKERDNRTLLPRGYWSEPVIKTERTDSDVLDINPTVTPGLYDISSTTRPGFISLGIYWTPLNDCDLHDGAENVFYKLTTPNKTVNVRHPNFYASVDIPKSTTLKATLQSVNSIGPGPSPTDITVFPANIGPSPSQLVIEYNRTAESCVTMAEIILSENQPHISDVFHTLVWCLGTKHVCQEPIKWKQLISNETSINFAKNMCDHEYRYGLVTHGYSEGQGQIVHTGIHWEPCVYQLGKVPKVPLKNVHLTDIQPNHGFSVEWENYNCDNVKAYITHNLVTYCEGEGTDKCKCTDDEFNVNVSRQSSSYTARDLKANTHYCVWVTGISKAGRGPANIKPLVHKVTAKPEISYTVGIVITVIFVVAALLIVIFIFAHKKYKKWKEECGQIRVVEMEGQGLLNVMTMPNTPTNNDKHTDDVKEPEKAEDRKYSIGDIIAGLNVNDKLKGNYQEPSDINSYMKAGSVSEQSSAPDHHDDCDDQSSPLIAPGTNDTVTEDVHIPVDDVTDHQLMMINNRQYVKRPDRNNEVRGPYGNNKVRDHYGNSEGRDPYGDNEGWDHYGSSEGRDHYGNSEGRDLFGNIEGRDHCGNNEESDHYGNNEGWDHFGNNEVGAHYRAIEDGDHLRNNFNRDHYKSISSVLSDAHSEKTGVSLEDLHSHRNSVDVNAILPTFTDLSKSIENMSKITKVSKETTETENNALDYNEQDSDSKLDSDSVWPLNNGTNQTSGPVDDNLVQPANAEKYSTESSDRKGIREDSNEIKPNTSVEGNEDVLWDSGDCTDFNELMSQCGNHYQQTSDIDAEDTFKLSNNDLLHKEGDAVMSNNDWQLSADNSDFGITHNHINICTNKGINHFDCEMNEDKSGDKASYTEKEQQEDFTNKQSEKVKHVRMRNQKNEQINNKLFANDILKNTNGLITNMDDITTDKQRTSVGSNSSTELQSVKSLDNSGTLHSYVTAGNDMSGEPVSGHDLQSENLKCNFSNINGGISENKQSLDINNEQ